MENSQYKSRTIFENLTDIYIGCMLSVFLLFPGFGGYEQITIEKGYLFFILSGGYVLLTLLIRIELIVVDNDTHFPDIVNVCKEFDISQKLILGYLIMTAIATIFAVDCRTAFFGGGRLEGFLTIALYCCLFLLTSYFGRVRMWMLWLFAAAVSINCILSIVQLAGYNPLLLYPHGMTYYDAYTLYSGEFLGTIGNVDLLSAVLCISVPIFLTAVIKLEDKIKFILIFPICLCIYVLMSAYVEGGIVGIAGSVLIAVPVIVNRGTLRKTLVIVLIMFIIVFTAGVYFFGEKTSGFIYEASEIMHGNCDDSFGSSRIYIWRNVAGLVKERPFIGGGPDTLSLRKDIYFERYDENLNVVINSFVDTAHNEYLNVLVNQGVIALICYLAALFAAAIRWVKTAPDNKAVAILGAGILGYCIQAFFGISSLIAAPYLWISFALLINNLIIEKRGDI